jgi:hypothetical protein
MISYYTGFNNILQMNSLDNPNILLQASSNDEAPSESVHDLTSELLLTPTKISFRCPVHHSPCAIAHTFTYEPFISLKIDGVFFEFRQETNGDKYTNFYPIFPQNWTKIEGECYERENGVSIYYIFYIELDGKIFSSLLEMFNEIEAYFLSQVSNKLNFEYKVDTDIHSDLMNNITQSFEWADSQNESNNFIWWPKKYWQLNTISWNEYIDQLSDLYNFSQSPQIINLINHDGLVISPNYPSKKKSLVKLKPRKDLTIDLFFTGRDFTSRERTSYKHLVGKNDMVLQRNSVYRLAPDGKGKFIPVYKREIGKKPNPNNIISDILHKYNNYFKISQLKDQYVSPWYGEIYTDRLNEVLPLFNYVQAIYNSVLPHMSNGIVFDIGCGSMGQYSRHFMSNPELEKYIGLDIDLAKLHEAQVKVKYNDKFAFMLMNISQRWNNQNSVIPNGLWNTYYYNLVKLNQKADNIISIFSSQYANTSQTGWTNYVNEINYRSKKGTKLFIMWVDYTKILPNIPNDYVVYNKATNKLKVKLPHRPEHEEHGLGNEILNSFNNNSMTKDKWMICTEIMNTINVNFDPTHEIASYMNLINYVVLIKK